MNPGEAPSLWMRAASGLEVLTGLGLVGAPSPLARLLFGSDLNAAGEATGRISGLVMLCLAAGCWPRTAGGEAYALAPLMALSWLAAAFLIVSGLIGANVGMLLWPAAALHLILAVLLTRAWMEGPRTAAKRTIPPSPIYARHVNPPARDGVDSSAEF